MGSVPIFLLLAGFLALPAHAEERVVQLKNGETLHYRVVEDRSESAQPAANAMLRHLAAGEIEDAALLSNAPKRRYEVLRDYLASVGEQEFERVYGQFLFPENRVVAEFAVGPRRLIVWDLGEAGHRLVGQYFVDVEGKFLMDDVPSRERARLAELLQAFRAEKRAPEATSPARTD
jgi:hypothetical protein